MDIRTGTTHGPIEIAYEDMGDASDPVILLIMGLGAQLTLWPIAFCERLVAAGHRVIRFDNRDIGLSTKLDAYPVDASISLSSVIQLVRHELGFASDVPYTIEDMAADTRGLLDHLGIETAHIVGASMGGMIAQVFAGSYPERTRSMSILFSSTNQAFLPPPDPRALLPLISGPGRGATREQIVAHSAKTLTTIGSPGYPAPPEVIIELASIMYDRCYHPAGVARQMSAITGTGSLLKFTRAVRVPTTVIHGKADRLLRPSCGKAVAKAVPGSTLTLIGGMAHDLPDALLDQLTGIILTNVARG